MLSRINHPGIVKLYFTFQDSTWLYLALELCPNGELAELVARKGRLPLDLVQFYAGELVNILTYLRKLGIAHRDIKPENLFITESGHLKLGDFDTAKVVMGGSHHASQPNNNQHPERMNTFVGTAQYVSPEMLHDSAVAGFGSDLWALGCVVFQMLTGAPPFKSNSEYVTFQKILATEYSFPDNVPQVGKDFVAALLTLDPQDRLGFFRIDDLKRHPFFHGFDLDTLEESAPPLTGVMRLRKRRIRMSSASVEDDASLLLDSSDDEEIGESSQLLDDDFMNLFSNAAPESSGLVRCATTAPMSGMLNSDDESISNESINIQRRSSIDGSSTPSDTYRATPTTGGQSGMFKKAGSSPALFGLAHGLNARAFSNVQPARPPAGGTVADSIARASSMGDESVSSGPVMIPSAGLPTGMKSWAATRNLSSKPSVIVESLMASHSRDSDDVSPESRQRASPLGDMLSTGSAESLSGPGMDSLAASSPTTAAALNNYLQRICASDEHILMSGPVLKRRFFGRNRILVVTDLPRLLVLEPKTFRTVCEIPLLSAPNSVAIPDPTSSLLTGADSPPPSSPSQSTGLVVRLVSPSEFTIDTETTSWRGEVKDMTSNAWVSLIQAMKQKALRTASLRPPRGPFVPRLVSPSEVNTRELLNRPDFGSVDVLGSIYAARGSITSDLPTDEELEAEAEARVDAALKLMADEHPEITAPEALVAALGRQISGGRAESSSPQARRSDPSSDDQYRIDVDDLFSSTNRQRRNRENSTSCSLM